MTARLFGKMINEQLELLLPRAMLLNLIILALAFAFRGFGIQTPLGLLLGTAAMTANIIILGLSSERAADMSSARRAKGSMFAFYLLRLALMGAALAAGFESELTDSVCTFIPLLYPKLIYTGSALFGK